MGLAFEITSPSCLGTEVQRGIIGVCFQGLFQVGFLGLFIQVATPKIQYGHDLHLKRLNQLSPVVDWHKLTYILLTCRKTPINQSIVKLSVNLPEHFFEA